MEIGINTMSMTANLQKDLEGTLQYLHEIGCDVLEGMSDWGARQETIDFYAQFTGPGAGWNPEVLPERLAIMERLGMKLTGLFVFDEVIAEQAKALGKHCRENGIRYVVFTFLHFRDLEEVYEKIALIKKVSRVLSAYDVKVAIHNHETDFVRMCDRDGKEKTLLEIFLENTDPQELRMEVDTGWVFYAGVDVPAFVRAHRDRIEVLHLKDIHPDYKTMDRDRVSVACGSGKVDFDGIFEALGREGLSKVRLVLDQDSSAGDILEDHKRSIAYIRGRIREGNRGE